MNIVIWYGGWVQMNIGKKGQMIKLDMNTDMEKFVTRDDFTL